MSQKINVCHIASGDLWAGAETQIFNLITSQNYQKEVASISILLNFGLLEKKLEESGVEVRVFSEKELGFIRILFRLIKFIRQRNITIIHSHRYKENLLAIIVAIMCDIPLKVKTVYGMQEIVLGLKKIKRQFYYFSDALLSKYFFDMTIAVTRDIASMLNKLVPPNKVRTIYNSVNLKELGQSTKINLINYPKSALSGNKIIVGTVGRLVPIKGLEYFVKASKIILEENSDMLFVIGGEGPQKKFLKELCKEMRIIDFYYFPGFVDDVYSLISSFKIFVISSLHEGFPSSLLEAMALGIPTVSTKVGGISEIIQDNENGVLVEPENAEALAEGIKSLMTNATLYKRIRRNALECVCSSHSAESHGKSVSRLYKRLLIMNT